MSIAEFLVSLWNSLNPLLVIKSYERGVKWVLGRNPRELKPGVHLRIPFFYEIESLDVVDTYIHLPVQSIITQDNRLVCFTVVLGFVIDDPVAHFCNVNDFEVALVGITASHLAKKVRSQSFELIANDLTPLERSLEGTLTTRVKDWGTRIIHVGFKDFTEVKYQARLFGMINE